MEKKFLKNKINNDFINKDFSEWTKETVDNLVMLINIDEFNKYHNVLFLLLSDYIVWVKTNRYKDNIDSNDNSNDDSNDNNDDSNIINNNFYSYEELNYIKNELYDKLYIEKIEKNNNNDSNNYLNDDLNNKFNKNTVIPIITKREYINDFGDDDIIVNNFLSFENILYFIIFMILLLIIRYLFSLFTYSNIHNKYDYEHYYNTHSNFNSNSNINSNSNTNNSHKVTDIFNNPIVSFLINKLI